MAFPSSGVYKVKNVATGTYLNLEGAGSAVGTPIVGYQDDGSAANLWQVVIDEDTGIATFQTAVTDTFIQTKDGGVSAGTALVTGSTAMEFQLVSNGNDEYRIHLTDEGTDMVFYLANATNYTPVIIQVNNNDSSNQLWAFIED